MDEVPVNLGHVISTEIKCQVQKFNNCYNYLTQLRIMFTLKNCDYVNKVESQHSELIKTDCKAHHSITEHGKVIQDQCGVKHSYYAFITLLSS